MSKLYESIADLHEQLGDQADEAARNGQHREATYLRNFAETLEGILDQHILEAA